MQKVAEFIRKHADCTAAVIIFLVTLLFFLPGLNFDPIPLDNSVYIGNEYLLYPTWDNLIYHLKNPVLELYSPLVMHSFMLDYWIWGKDLLISCGRLHNIILHALNAVMFFLLLRQLKLNRLDPDNPLTLSLPAAIFGALCFALHPQRVESVIWVVERKDVQVIFLGLASALLFIRSYQKNCGSTAKKGHKQWIKKQYIFFRTVPVRETQAPADTELFSAATAEKRSFPAAKSTPPTTAWSLWG
jgi:hypothetical protein